MNKNFEPIIIGFLCNWCAYAGADLAGTSRIQYPHNIYIIRVMCSGMVHPDLVIETFKNGADGVIVGGCRLGECHYLDGNKRAQEKEKIIKLKLKELGLEEERFRLEWIAASEAVKFAKVVNEMTQQLKNLGPSPYRRVKVSSVP